MNEYILIFILTTVALASMLDQIDDYLIERRNRHGR
jgi:hypothetical protein